MENNSLWQQFVCTGKISDYLHYKNSGKEFFVGEHKNKRNSAERKYNPRKR